MHIFNDLYRDDFLLDDDEDFSNELFEENEAVALEDLLHLVQEYGEMNEADLRPGHFCVMKMLWSGGWLSCAKPN